MQMHSDHQRYQLRLSCYCKMLLFQVFFLSPALGSVLESWCIVESIIRFLPFFGMYRTSGDDSWKPKRLFLECSLWPLALILYRQCPPLLVLWSASWDVARQKLVNQLSIVTFLPVPDIGEINLLTVSPRLLLLWKGPSSCLPTYTSRLAV